MKSELAGAPTAASTAAATASAAELADGGMVSVALSRFLSPRSANAVEALALRAVGLATAFAVSVGLGRLLGARGAGEYFLYNTWTNVLGTIFALGLPPAVLRWVARFEERRDYAASRRMVWGAVGAVALAGAVGAVAVGVAPERLAVLLLGDSALTFLLRMAVLSGIFTAVLRVLADALKSRGRASAGLTVEFSVVPFGVLLCLAAAVLAGVTVRPATAIWSYALAAAAAIAIAARLLFRRWPRATAAASAAGAAAALNGEHAISRRELAGFWAVDLLGIVLVNSAFVVLPHVASPADVGRFGVAHRLVSLGSVSLMAFASLFAPQFARLHESGDPSGLRGALRSSQFYCVLAFVPLLLVYVVLGPYVLAVFGAEFRSAAPMLWVMSAGQLIAMTAGLSSYFLLMTGHQNWDVGVLAVSLVVTAALAVIGGRVWGAFGVAAAYGASIALRALLAYCAARVALRGLSSTGAARA
ncbi:MAG TPA: hypothetical protein VKA84_05860 [Gemmatimonadaceae bacterium]|nr:hypothetical protein [Gemmatimonadaceae bacterium]